jgi:hypothetical protein
VNNLDSPNIQALRELKGIVCAVCGRSKGKGRSFCFSCYISLPANLQKRLYERYGAGYTENYFEAKNWLLEEKKIQ